MIVNAEIKIKTNATRAKILSLLSKQVITGAWEIDGVKFEIENVYLEEKK